MENIRAFILGMMEFRSSFTAHYEDDDVAYSYDWGREWAHRLTFRYYEGTS